MYLIGPSDGAVSRYTLRLEIYSANSVLLKRPLQDWKNFVQFAKFSILKVKVKGNAENFLRHFGKVLRNYWKNFLNF